ncbi:MAG: response regulator [Bacteroidota bacterium]
MSNYGQAFYHLDEVPVLSTFKAPAMSPTNNPLIIVEDHLESLENLLEIFELESYQVLSCKNGEECIDLIRLKTPGLILSDIKLPGMDGFDLLRHVKSQAASEAIPFIFLTAYADRHIREHSLRLGAVDYLVKPCHMETLLSTVGKYLA